MHAALESLSTSLSVTSKMVRHGSAGWHESLADFEWPRMFSGVFPVRGKRPALALSFAEQTLPLEDFCRSVIGINNKARGFPLFDVKSPPFRSIYGLSPWDREVRNSLGPPMRHRCVYCCQITCQFDSCRCSSRGTPAMAHAHGETIKTESPDLALGVSNVREPTSDLDAAAEHGPDINFLVPRWRLSSHSCTPPRSNCSAAPFLEDHRVCWASRRCPCKQ